MVGMNSLRENQTNESYFSIRGGFELAGEIPVRGSKNTILPIIAATLLTREPCIIENVPRITDANVMLQIAESLGAEVEWDEKNHRVTIQARNIKDDFPDTDLSRRLRGSVLFAGALLARTGRARMSYPGGDIIGARPLITHFNALKGLGVTISEGDVISLDGTHMRGARIFLEEPSVTATENVILASIRAPGKTEIRLPACEPHVQELVAFLARMGAKIRWRDLYWIEVEGVEKLHGATHRINPDDIEISSFAALAAATRSSITLTQADSPYLDAIFLQLSKMGVSFRSSGGRIEIHKPKSSYTGFRIQSGLYPKLMSDHIPPFAVLATQAEGASLIHDWMYENRLRYIAELQKMGADASLLDPHRAIIRGPTKLVGCKTVSSDIRSGMTLVVAALVAEGESMIEGVHHLDRGYEKIEERLQSIGARIRRVKNE